MIGTLVCDGCVDWKALSNRLCVPVPTLKAVTAYDEQKLSVFVNDGLTCYADDYPETITEDSALIRNIAASLDKLMLYTPHPYSEPL